MMEIRPDEKTNCVTAVAKDNFVVIGLENGDRTPLNTLNKDIYRKFTPVELERLQTMKDDSTKWGLFEDGSIKQISDSQRTKICGNGWTQYVITHFFKYIK